MTFLPRDVFAGLTPKIQDLHLADGLHLAIITITNYVHNVWIM